MNEAQSRQDKVMRETVILSLVFFFLLTTFLSFYYIIVFILSQDPNQYSYTGMVAIGSNFIFYLIGLSFTSTIRNYKRQLLIVACCFAANYAVYLPGLTHFWGLMAVIVGSLMSGPAMAVLWVSQGGYISTLFRLYEVREEEEGRYIGVMNTLIYVPILFGALVTLAVTAFSKTAYLFILVGLCLVGFIICYFFLDPLEEEPLENEEEIS